MVLVIGVGRVVTILPNKMIGVIGEHAEYPIERLAFSHDRTTLGSASHDNTVKLWDVKYLQEGDDEASEGVDTKQQASLGENTGSQGHGQTDSTIISGDDSDDEMEAEGSRRRKKKGKQPALPSKGKSKFFEDL
jgi:WD40 repeat protein